jgi:hypothetical protein
MYEYKTEGKTYLQKLLRKLGLRRFGRYKAAGKIYVQKPLVLGQIKQLTAALGNIAIPVSAAADLGAISLLAMLGDRLPDILAVVLIEDGTPLREKDLDALAAEIAATFDLEMTVQVIEDFFDCNPAASILERLTQVMGNIMTSIRPPG